MTTTPVVEFPVIASQLDDVARQRLALLACHLSVVLDELAKVKVLVPDEALAAEVQATHDLASATRSLLLGLCNTPASASLPSRSVL